MHCTDLGLVFLIIDDSSLRNPESISSGVLNSWPQWTLDSSSPDQLVRQSIVRQKIDFNLCM